MRFTAAYYLVLIYVTVVVKPLIPFIHDEWVHEFNEIEHISTVHAKYGSNHVEKELAGSDAGNDKSSNQHTLRAEDQVPFHILIHECKYDPEVNKNPQRYFPYKLNGLPLISISSPGKPPEFS